MRSVQTLKDWKFYEGNPAAAAPDFDDTDWKPVTVPHDWAIARPLNHREAEVQLSIGQLDSDPRFTYASAQGFYERWGIGWYRRKMDFALDDTQTAWLTFDGVYHETTAYLNGYQAGSHAYGYTPFVIPATPGILALRVDNMPEHEADRWYSGCGIFRPVTLTVTDKLHISPWGIAITTPKVSDKEAAVQAVVELTNGFAEAKEATVHLEVIAPDGSCAAESSSLLQLPSEDSAKAVFLLKITKPRRWDIINPALYTLRITIERDGEAVDSVEQAFGIRTIEFVAKKGFFLNGRSVKFKGVNLHHDLGMTGAAWHKGIARQRLQALKAIGCNAIRTSHNPPAAEFLDLCDEMGFLVMDEAFDKWDTLRYGLIFKSDWQQDLDSMIDRDRNHPCVVIWSVGNEVNHQAHDDMIERLKMLTDRVREKDPTRPVTFAMEPHAFDPEQVPLSPLQKANLVKKMKPYVDILSCNYHEQWYKTYQEQMPDALFVGTETCPFYRGVITHEGYLPVNPWLDCKDDAVIGQFVWAGIDYLGEAVGCGGWPVRGWAGGLIDTAGQIKAKAQLTRSLWQEEPMVAMAICDDTLKNPMEPAIWSTPKWAEGWNFEHLGVTCVRMNVFTNCEEAEIQLNGGTILRRHASDFTGGFMEFFVPWVPGEVTAIGYRGGQEVCRQTAKTAGAPHHIALVGKRLTDGDGTQLLRVEACAVDEKGVPCTRCGEVITFAGGEGLTLIGTDNGDLTDHTPYTSSARALHNGRCVAYYTVADPNAPQSVAVQTDKGLTGII